MPKLAGNKKSANKFLRVEGGQKKIRGCEKNSAEHQKMFGADLRIIGEQKQILGSEENIFRDFVIFRGLKKKYPTPGSQPFCRM
jgi:hypothetical protein